MTMPPPTEWPPDDTDAATVIAMLERAGTAWVFHTAEEELPPIAGVFDSATPVHTIHAAVSLGVPNGYEPLFVFNPDGSFVGIGMWY